MEEQDNRNYIQNQVHPIYERMLIDLLLNKPDDPVDYMISWLKNKGQQFQTSFQQTTSLNQFKQQHKVMKDEDKVDSDEDGDDEEDFDDNYLQKLEKTKAKNPQGRSSVSAEVFGNFNKKGDFKAKVISKTQEQKDKIFKRLQQAFMFSALDDKERDIVINAMEEFKYSEGDWIIEQGQDGEYLFVVDQGELDCYKKFSKDQDEPTYLKTYQPGESFGELSLLYNAPRAASIKAKGGNAVCFGLDRQTFNHIVKDAAAKKREKYEDFLGSVDLLKGMDAYDRSKIADALKSVNVKAGEMVIKEGEEGDTFFMIEEGSLAAYKNLEGEEKRVKEYKRGDFFGELALKNNAPRAASVKAEQDCKLVVLDRYSFKRLLGPVDDLLDKKYD